MQSPSLSLISWNMNQRPSTWEDLLTSGADAALLQEAKEPPAELHHQLALDAAGPWRMSKYQHCRTATVGLSDRIEYIPFPTQAIGEKDANAIMVSRAGTISAALVRIKATGEELIIVSLYSYWESPIGYSGSSWIYADASAHRLISDLSVFIGQQTKHKIIAAGDLNILYGYGEGGSDYWKKRYDTVFQRMEALGLKFIGPQAPNGIQANPWPKEQPRDSKNVPTYRTKKEKPETATRQLDYVFASESIADRVSARATNGEQEWGQSDHCQILIELAP